METDTTLYPKTRAERIAVLKAISDSSKAINFNGTEETRVVFDDNRTQVLMDVLDPFNDWSYEWTASALPDMLAALEEDTFDEWENSDAMFEYADAMVDIYNRSLMAWAARNIEEVDDALKESGLGLIQSIQYAQHGAIIEHLNKLQALVIEYVDGAEVQE